MEEQVKEQIEELKGQLAQKKNAWELLRADILRTEGRLLALRGLLEEQENGD